MKTIKKEKLRFINRILLVIISSSFFFNCTQKTTEFNLNENHIAAAIETYKFEDKDRIVILLKNLFDETKNIILIGEIQDSVVWPIDDIVLEVKQNLTHTYSYSIKFRTRISSNSMPTLYKLEKDSVIQLTLEYIGNLRHDFNLSNDPFEIRALIIPSKDNQDMYFYLYKDHIKNLLVDTIKTQFLRIK